MSIAHADETISDRATIHDRRGSSDFQDDGADGIGRPLRWRDGHALGAEPTSTEIATEEGRLGRRLMAPPKPQPPPRRCRVALLKFPLEPTERTVRIVRIVAGAHSA